MNDTKKCSLCQEMFLNTVDFFHKKGDRLTSKCKECSGIYNRQMYAKHREKRLDQKKEYGSRVDIKEKRTEYNKKYYNENREDLLKRQSEYEVKNKDRFRDRRSKHRLNRYHNDPHLKIKMNLSNRLRKLLDKDLRKTIDFIGCSVHELKIYLENKFQDGMSWENYGKYGWHIDHITPCASFDLTNNEEQLKCFHYTNLQPLWAIDNLKKGSKLPPAL